jgi:hypothetical protein
MLPAITAASAAGDPLRSVDRAAPSREEGGPLQAPVRKEVDTGGGPFPAKRKAEPLKPPFRRHRLIARSDNGESSFWCDGLRAWESPYSDRAPPPKGERRPRSGEGLRRKLPVPITKRRQSVPGSWRAESLGPEAREAKGKRRTEGAMRRRSAQAKSLMARAWQHTLSLIVAVLAVSGASLVRRPVCDRP